jgi:hypothetical protein
VALSHDTAIRLSQLEQILAATAARTASAGSDAAGVHMSSVPSERIRALTVALDDGNGRDVDELDAVVMRLLLEEYVTAVSHLRAVARLAAARIDAATAPVREARRAVHRYSKAVESAPATRLDAAAAPL